MMETEERIRNYLLEYGLKQKEIDDLEFEDAIQYLRFYHGKDRGISRILFLGFAEDETIWLSNKAEKCNLTVYSQNRNNLNFICALESADKKKIEKAKANGVKFLSKVDFEIIFGKSEYHLKNNDLLYDQAVSEDLRIAKPLSNFNKNVEVKSFSNSEVYTVNLFEMTCSCIDFKKRHRNEYLKGDIRRLCKHLMSEYKNCFGLFGLSEFNNFIIENHYSLKRTFRKFSLGKLPLKPLQIVVNFDIEDDWWIIYTKNEKGIFTRYTFFPSENNFSFDNKPYGYVKALRVQLDLIKSQLAKNYGKTFESEYQKIKRESSKLNKQNKKVEKLDEGCVNAIVIIAVIVFIIIVFIEYIFNIIVGIFQ